MKIGVEEIKRALKPHFIWSKDPSSILDVDPEWNESQGIATVIFIGIATMYGIDPVEIKDYLDIPHTAYKGKLAKFYYYVSEGRSMEDKGRLNIESVEGRHYSKYRLCMNYITLNYHQEEIVPLEKIFKL
jgi:hypothetical protein